MENYFHLEQRIKLLEERNKLLEEEIMYIYKDLENLTNILENIQPETHTHYTFIVDSRPCMDCDPNNTNDLNDLT